MSLFLNMLSSFTKTYLSRNNHLLIPWMQSLSTVILEPKKIKSLMASTFTPFISIIILIDKVLMRSKLASDSF